MRKSAFAAALGLSLIAAAAVPAAEDVMIVYDASGSMWGQIEGVSKIEIAREVIGDLLVTWPQGINLGLVAYGHRREGDCADIETVVPAGPVDRSAFLAVVEGIDPLGRTPLSGAVERAAEELSYRDNPATVVLISDGIENCQADPCALAAQLAGAGIGFTAHVIGFDLATDEHQHLACIAENTGGLFVPAQNAAELAAAVQQVGEAIIEQPAPEPAPEPEPEPELPAVTIGAPDTAVVGTDFAVSWSEAVEGRDWVTVVPVGADEGAYTSYVRVGTDSETTLRAPAEPGLYEVRYVLDEGSRTLARAPIEVVEAQVSITAPESALIGEGFGVSWSAAVHPRDWVTVVAMGADEGAYTSYTRVGSDGQTTLRAPAEPGLYEVRYVLDEGSRTLARAPIEVVAAEVSITAPESALIGEEFTVAWSGVIHPRDWVTVVAMGADEGAYTSYTRVGANSETGLRAPASRASTRCATCWTRAAGRWPARRSRWWRPRSRSPGRRRCGRATACGSNGRR